LDYHVEVHELAQRVGRFLRERDLLRPGDRTGVAVSGGIDSVALLRLLLELREELGLVLSVVHVNHKIRGAEADADQQFVADLACAHGLRVHVFSGDAPAYAAAHHLGLEAAARAIRYQYFQQLLTDGLLDKVATAHTLDDQAETVLLRLARGTGITGLAGIYPKWSLAGGQCEETAGPDTCVGTAALGRTSSSGGFPSAKAIVRPLLAIQRSDLQLYLESLSQSWREDATNLDLRYARNRVRHKLLPLLQSELNPRIRELLAETAELARAEEDYWAAIISAALSKVWTASSETDQYGLRISELRRLPLAVQRRLVRAAAQSLGLHLEFHHVEEILALAASPASGEKQVPIADGWRALRARHSLTFQPPSSAPTTAARDFEYPLSIPGEISVPETGTRFCATLGPPISGTPAYDPGRLPGVVQVRNWRPGDRFWPAHSRAPKKVKELLQQRKVPLAQRPAWPVIAAAGEIVWLRGFPPPQHLLAAPGPGLIIEEYALQGAPHRAE